MKQISVIAHNIRSAHNVGALFRLCDGVGVEKLYLSGYTPYPEQENDSRLPHESRKTTSQIQKTALGAEKTVEWQRIQDINELINQLRSDGYKVVALEQDTRSTELMSAKTTAKLALLIGEEVNGIDPQILKTANDIIEIPMLGRKESHNVITATSMALYQLRYINR